MNNFQSMLSKKSIVLLAGDWLGLMLFVLIGQLDHGMVGDNPLPRLLTTTAELAVMWTAVSLLMGTYRLTPETTVWQFLGRSLNAWLVAAPLALLLRAFLHGQVTIIIIFMSITMGVGGSFLLSWRFVYFLLARRFKRRSRLVQL